MDAEAKKSYTHGFVLKEADLRRMVEVITEQLHKLPGNPKIESLFRVKFRNGVIAETGSLDEVTAQENLGSGQIIRLSSEFTVIESENPTHIHVEFINVDEDDVPGYVSARFTVFGHSRDWVFVTSSLIEERIDKIKRFAVNQLGEVGPSRVLFRLLAPIIMLLILAPTMLMPLNDLSTLTKAPRPVQKLEEVWRSGKIKDPVEAIIILEKERDSRMPQVDFFPFAKGFLYVLAGITVLIGVFAFFVKYYPVYNFCWGEYMDIFNKKEATRQFWLVVIIIGIVVSFIGGILANSIGLWKPS